MGYKMPNVVKEIYLPIPRVAGKDSLTPAEYKEIFGLDLYDVFYVNNGLWSKDFAKLYIVDRDGLSNGFSKVSPIVSILLDENEQEPTYILRGLENTCPQNAIFVTLNYQTNEIVAIGYYDGN